MPEYLKPFAVASSRMGSGDQVRTPIPARYTASVPTVWSRMAGYLPYQQLNGILADEMGLGYNHIRLCVTSIHYVGLSGKPFKHRFLAHLACDRGIWGPPLDP